MKWAGVAAGLLLVALLGAVCMWRFGGPSYLRFPYLMGPAASSESALRGFAVSSLEVAPGVTLRTAVRAPTSAEAPWLIFFPGNDEKQLEQGARFLTRVAGAADVGVATFAYRGFDGSTGVMAPETAAADARAFLASLKVPASRQVIIAFSMGAPVAAQALEGLPPPRKLVLVAGASGLAMLPRSPLAKVLRGDVYEATDAVARLSCPVEVMHGSADTTLPPSMAEVLAERAKTRAQVLPGLTHVTILEQATVTW